MGRIAAELLRRGVEVHAGILQIHGTVVAAGAVHIAPVAFPAGVPSHLPERCRVARNLVAEIRSTWFTGISSVPR